MSSLADPMPNDKPNARFSQTEFDEHNRIEDAKRQKPDKPHTDRWLARDLIDSLRVEDIAKTIAWQGHDEIFDKLPPARQRDYREAAIVALRLGDPDHDWRKIAMLLALEHGAGMYAADFSGEYETLIPHKLRAKVYHVLTSYAVALFARLTNDIPVLPHEQDMAEAQGASLTFLREGRLR